MDQLAKHKSENHKVLRKNTEVSCHDLEFSNGFLDMTSLKLKHFMHQRTLLKKWKDNLLNERKYYISEKSLVSRIYFLKTLTSQQQKDKNPIKWAKNYKKFSPKKRYKKKRRGINGKQVHKKLLNISWYHSLVVVVVV